MSFWVCSFLVIGGRGVPDFFQWLGLSLFYDENYILQ